MKNKIASILDSIANRLEARGLVKQAYSLDVIANTLDDFYDRHRDRRDRHRDRRRESITLNDFKKNFEEDLPVLISRIFQDDKDKLNKYEEDYLKLTDRPETSLVEIAKFLNELKREAVQILERFNKNKIAANIDSFLRNIKDVVKEIEALINDIAKLLSKGVKSIYNKEYSSPEILKQKKEKMELKDKKEKGREILYKMPFLSISSIAPTLKKYIRKGDTVKLNALVDEGAKSWYGFWHGHILSVGSGKNEYRFYVSDQGANILHGGYDVTGAHYKTKDTIKSILTKEQFKIDEGNQVDLSEIK